MQDIKFAFRMLARFPVVSAVAITTLALAIGAVTLIFSVVNGVLLTPLPYESPDELVLLWSRDAANGLERSFVSPMEFSDWREQNTAFEQVAAFWRTQYTVVEDGGEPTRVQAGLVSENLHRLTGSRPVLGRVFAAEDGIPGAPRVAVLGHGLWQRRFGSDPAIIGKILTVDDVAAEVVGVLGPDQAFPEDTEVWININFPYSIQSRFARWLNVVGRLRDGVTLEAAQADMDGLAARLASEYPQSNSGWTITMASLHDTVVGDVRPALLVLLAATALILVIACANVANLMLSRAEARAREVALRTALGASRGRLARQLLTESLVMAAIAAAAGTGIALLGLRALDAVAPTILPRLADVGIDARVMGVTLLAVLFTGLVFGMAPVVRLLRSDLTEHLKEGTKGSRGPEGQRLQGAFVVAQIALAAVLVVGSGLLVRSFANLRAVDPGFRTSGLLTFEVDVPDDTYASDADVALFYDRLLEAMGGIAGADAAAVGSSLPLRESRDYNGNFAVVDRVLPEETEPRAYYRQVSPEYFEAMGVALIEGRGFNSQDQMDARGVAVINRTLARQYFGDDSPVNERLGQVGGRYGPLGVILPDEVEIVGVVDDVRYGGLKLDAEASIYFVHRQAPFRRMTVALRTTGDPDALLGAARETLWRLDPGMPMSNVATIESVVSDALARDRFATLLLSVFGGVALLLAAIGIYGVLSFAVQQRTREMGIRMALGAQSSDVLTLVMRDGAVLLALGLLSGLAAAFAFTRLLQAQLFGVSAADPLTFGVVAALLAAVSLGASWLPARRATLADPLQAIRDE